MSFFTSLLAPFRFVERKLKEATKRKLTEEDMKFIKRKGQVTITHNRGAGYVAEAFGTHKEGFIHTRTTTHSPTELRSSSIVTRTYNAQGALKRRTTELFGGLRHNVTKKDVRYEPNGRLFGRKVSTNPSQLKMPHHKR